MLGTRGYHCKPMTRKEFMAHPDKMFCFDTKSGKKNNPMLHQGDKRPIQVIFID